MPVPVQVPSDLVTPKSAAKILCCSLGTIYRLVHRGQLRAWCRGGCRYLVSDAAVRAILQPVQPAVPVPTLQAVERRQEEARETLRQSGVRA